MAQVTETGPGKRPTPVRTPMTVPSRFRGPSRSGNGGYVCGRIAAYADGPVTVTLRRPPPLATPMAVERGDDGSLRILAGRTLIAEATAAPDPLAAELPGPVPMADARLTAGRGAGLLAPDLPGPVPMADARLTAGRAPGLLAPDLPGPVSLAEARLAAGRARYFQDPVFPECFVCGTSRRPGDGLRIFPGPLPGRAVWAAPWTPDPSVAGEDGKVRPEVVWAALDCPSGIAAAEHASLGQDTAIVLGRMTANLTELPAAGDECRVIAWPGGRDGRKLTAWSALLGTADEVVAVARTVWVTMPRVPTPDEAP